VSDLLLFLPWYNWFVPCFFSFVICRDLFHLVALTCSSHRRLAAEDLFLRKQLAFYIERQVKRGA
jgi:hypothetical protein